MIKKILLSLTILGLSAGVYLYFEFNSKKTLITPYTYSFGPNALEELKLEIPKAEEAKILIVGDRMGQALDNYVPKINENLSKIFKVPPKFYNWSKTNEGLYRTLFKLKSLKKIPPLVIYHGASTELSEKTFAIDDKDAIIENFRTYDNEKLISMIITFPWLSKILYQKMNYYVLEKLTEYNSKLPGHEKLVESELSFKLYTYQLRELIAFIKDKKSNLILMTTPLNLEIRPKEVCSHSTSNDIIELQQEIDDLNQQGKYKESYPKAFALSNETFGNALSFFQLGQSALGLGKTKMAREAFQKSTVFDCSHWRGNAVYNAIIKKEGGKQFVHIIDFDQFMSASLSKEGLFNDEIFPQTLFYYSVIQELEETIKKILSIKN